MTSPARRFVPGELAIHPVVAGAVVLLFVNDHLLKPYYAGWLTGKLSDVAGLIAAPLLLQASVELLTGAKLPRGRAVPLVLCSCVGAMFMAMELTDFGDAAFRYGLGVVQWPLRALLAWDLVKLRPVAHVADAEDLWALLALWLAFEVGASRARSYEQRTHAGNG